MVERPVHCSDRSDWFLRRLTLSRIQFVAQAEPAAALVDYRLVLVYTLDLLLSLSPDFTDLHLRVDNFENTVL